MNGEGGVPELNGGRKGRKTRKGQGERYHSNMGGKVEKKTNSLIYLNWPGTFDQDL